MKTIIIIYFLCEVTVEKYEVKQLRTKVLQSCFLVTSFFTHISQQTFICPALFLSFSCKELSDMKRLVLVQTYKGSSLKHSHLLTSSSSKFIRARSVGRWIEGMRFPTSPQRLDLTACLTEPHIKPSSTSFNLTSNWGMKMWYTTQAFSIWVCLLF